MNADNIVIAQNILTALSFGVAILVVTAAGGFLLQRMRNKGIEHDDSELAHEE